MNKNILNFKHIKNLIMFKLTLKEPGQFQIEIFLIIVLQITLDMYKIEKFQDDNV